MPCRNDYMEPSNYEFQNRRAARLLVMLTEYEGNKPTAKLLADSENTYLQKDYVKILCERMRKMTKLERDHLLYDDPRHKGMRELATWWEEHEERDRIREAKEREIAEEKDLAKKALAKLSKEELKALKARHFSATDYD